MLLNEFGIGTFATNSFVSESDTSRLVSSSLATAPKFDNQTAPIGKVAIIDSGVSSDSVNTVVGPDFGYGGSSSFDTNGHGTEVSNTIQQFLVSNGLTDGKLVSIKATQGNTADATIESITASLNWVLQNRKTYGIDAINISLGYGNSSKGASIGTIEPYFKLLEEAGIFIAIAAGNGYSPSSSEGINTLATSQYVTAVGATWDRSLGYQSFSTGAVDYSTDKDRIASFSQRDAGLDILAPGGGSTRKISTAIQSFDRVLRIQLHKWLPLLLSFELWPTRQDQNHST